MPHKTVILNVIPVWVAYAISWILQLTVTDWMNMITIVKDLIALVGFALAAGYTFYKFRKDWNGWNPKSKKKKKLISEEDDA